MFEFRRLYCPRAKLHAPFPFDGLLIMLTMTLPFLQFPCIAEWRSTKEICVSNI